MLERKLNIIVLAFVFVCCFKAYAFSRELNKINIYQLGANEFVFKIYGVNLPEPEILFNDDKKLLTIILQNTITKNNDAIELLLKRSLETINTISDIQIKKNPSGDLEINISSPRPMSLNAQNIPQNSYTFRITAGSNELFASADLLKAGEKKLSSTQNFLNFNDGRTITLDLYDVPLSASLKMIGDISGYNVLIDKSTPYEIVTASLKNIRADNAFNYLMKLYGVSCFRIDKNTIAFGTCEGLSKLSGQDETRAFYVSWAELDTVKNNLVNLIGIPENNIAIDKRTRKIYIKTNPAKINEAENLLRTLDTPARQIMIHASIFEFNDSAALDIESGLNAVYDHWQLNFDTGMGFVKYTGDRFAREITNTFTTLERKGKGKILANPSVIVIDGCSADISLTEKYPYVSDRDDNGNVTWRTTSIGPQLIFTPRTASGGYINLELTIKTGEVIGFATGSNGEVMPRTSDRSVNTKIRVRDGMPFVIGGLYRDNENNQNIKFPILSDIPLIGQLFKYKYTEHNKTQVVILVTPYILDTD